jgi:hypothetical protein
MRPVAGTDPDTQAIQRRPYRSGVYRLTKLDEAGNRVETVMHGESLEEILVYVGDSRHDWIEIRDEVTDFLLWEKATGLNYEEGKD